MSDLNGRKLTVVRLHTVYHMTGVGQIGQAVDANSSKGGLGQMQLTKVSGGVHLKVGPHEAFIPDGNIAGMQLAPLEPAKTSK